MKQEILEMMEQLPPDKQEEVKDFVGFLLSRYKITESREAIAEMRKRNAGRLKGQIWMADDFNETPEDFKDYI